MTAKRANQTEDDAALEHALGVCSCLENSEAKALRARVSGTNGYEVSLTEFRIGHLHHKVVMKGDIAEGDKAFGWKGFIPGLKATFHPKGIRFTADGMPTVVVYT